jgi:molybdopterin converting factor small subunit
MMQIEIRLFAGLRVDRFKKWAVDVAEGACLGDVVQSLGIPVEEVTLPLVNGKYSEMSRPIVADDVLSLFPAVAGG